MTYVRVCLDVRAAQPHDPHPTAARQGEGARFAGEALGHLGAWRARAAQPQTRACAYVHAL